MTEREKAIYLGKGKEIGQWGKVAFSICLDAIPTDSIFEYKGKKYVKMIMSKNKMPDNYGKTHSVSLDTFKPEKREEEPAQAVDTSYDAGGGYAEGEIDPKDIPF